MSDLIDRQAAIDAIVNNVSEIGLHDNSEVARYGATFRQHEIIDIIEGMPDAQPDDAEANYWHEKANSYEQTLVKLAQNIAEQPERKKGKWTNDNGCQFCGFQPWFERDIHTLSFCPHCGADMRGEQDD